MSIDRMYRILTSDFERAAIVRVGLAAAAAAAAAVAAAVAMLSFVLVVLVKAATVCHHRGPWLC